MDLKNQFKISNRLGRPTVQLEVFQDPCGAILILPQNAKIRKNPRGILDIIIHLMLVKFRQKYFGTIISNGNKNILHTLT